MLNLDLQSFLIGWAVGLVSCGLGMTLREGYIFLLRSPQTITMPALEPGEGRRVEVQLGNNSFDKKMTLNFRQEEKAAPQ